MEGITYTTKEINRDTEKMLFLKYFLLTYNLVLFLCSLVLLAIGIWLAVDRNFLSTIIGNYLYAAAVFLILAAGVVLFVMSFIGCCGVIGENVLILSVVLFIVLCVVAAALIIGGILAIIFRGQIGNAVKDTMSNTLVNYYGFGFDSQYNRAVTDAWDRAQERLQCCGVTNNGWYLYRKSQWFLYFGAQDGRDLTYEESDRPYVPLSCCVKDRLWRYINQDVCQTWRLGPPGSPVDGAINRAVYYTGCFEAGYAYMKSNSVILIGLGLAIGISLVSIGLILEYLNSFNRNYALERRTHSIIGIVVCGFIILRLRQSAKTGY